MAAVLQIAAWFGLFAGIVEGVGFMAFQGLSRLNWNRSVVPVAPEILWVAPLVDLVLFGALGVVFAVVGLYDLQRDPGELRNLAQQPEVRDVVTQLGSLISSLGSPSQSLSLRRPQPAEGGDTADALGAS